MQSLIRSACLLFGSASLVSAATLNLLNVDFGPGSTTTEAGVLGTAGDTWNKVTGATSISSTPLNWADGSSSGITLSQTSGTYHASFNSGSTTSSLMMKDYIFLYAAGTNGPVTFRLSGFAANSTLASIVLYGNGDTAGQNSSFTVGGQPTETTIASQNTAAVPTSSTPEGDIYVRFDNVLVDGSGNVDITWTNPAGGSNWSAFNGMQIQTVPEPTAALLGGLGVLALLRRRR